MPKQNDKQILENTKSIIGLEKDVAYIKEAVDLIRTNELAHIADDIKSIELRLNQFDVGEARQAPLHGILWEIFRYIIIGLVAALGVVIANNMGVM